MNYPHHKRTALDYIGFGRLVINSEADALIALAEELEDTFSDAVRLILEMRGSLVIGGLGKSGHIARKIAATFRSTGTRAFFLHLSEAVHGDLGAVREGDVVMLISSSGETPELVPVIRHVRDLEVPIIGISTNPNSQLLSTAAAALRLPNREEAGPEALAPTTTTTMTLALGDALAMTVMRARNFRRSDFGRLHPGGALGYRLSPVSQFMHGGDDIPLVPTGTPMLEAVVEMSEKRLGAVGVIDAKGMLAGIVSDGDLRRNVARVGEARVEELMTEKPVMVLPDTTMGDAMLLFGRHKITVLIVVDKLEDPKPLGFLHIHDLDQTKRGL